MKSFLAFLILTLSQTSIKSQVSDVTKNTELIMLNLRVFSLNEDSLRVHFKNKTYLDIFLKDKTLWGIKQYSKDSSKVQIGSFEKGNGVLNINIENYHFRCELSNGEFNGDFNKFRINRKGNYFLYEKIQYKNGIIYGTKTRYYGTKKNHKHKEIDYISGEKIAMRIYGEYVPILHYFGQLFPMLLITRNHGKVCREEFYEDGQFKNSNCYTKIRDCDCP